MVGSLITNSPITSFTRGAQGAIVPSDIVAILLILLYWRNSTKLMFQPVIPLWYRAFRRFALFALCSIVFIGPFFVNIDRGITGNVKNIIPGVSVELLLQLFNAFRIIMILPFIVYAARLRIDNDLSRYTIKLVWSVIVIIAMCEIINKLGIADMGLYLPEQAYQSARLLGYTKADVTRLFTIGIFVSLLLFYKSRLYFFIYLSGFTIIAVALFLAGGRAAFLAIIAGLVFMILFGRLRGKIIAGSFLLFVIILFFCLFINYMEYAQTYIHAANDPESNARWAIWHSTIDYLSAHPLTLITD